MKVLPEVQQDIDEPPPCLGGCAERAGVIATAPDPPAPTGGAVDGLGAPSRQPLQPAHERGRLVALDDEMDVIALHREMNDAERGFGGSRERSAQDWKNARRSEDGNRVARAQRDVHGPSRVVPGPRSMRGARPRSEELPARAHPRATPAWRCRQRRQLELDSPATSHRSPCRLVRRGVANRTENNAQSRLRALAHARSARSYTRPRARSTDLDCALFAQTALSVSPDRAVDAECGSPTTSGAVSSRRRARRSRRPFRSPSVSAPSAPRARPSWSS
jgi:hypothetical protein